ncbi:MAG: O-antigen ligase family protein, partial [Williamsia sp.]|nr:O-antigen ligase family protein [Williamsia sp.]
IVLHLRLNPRYLLALPIIWLAFSFAPAEMRARFDTLNTLLPNSDTAGQEDASLKRRSVEMLMAAYMFLDHPIVGVGSDNYRALYPTYIREYGIGDVQDEERNAHSYYLEIAAEHGVVGLATIAGVILLSLRSLLNARRWFEDAGDHRMAELAVAMSIAFAGYLVSAIFLHGDFDRFFWQQVDLAAACSVVAAHAYQRAVGKMPSANLTAQTAQPTATEVSPA